MKKVISLLLIVFFFISNLSPVLNSLETQESNTIYVDDDNTSGPWDGSIDYPFQFIQDGIDASSDGNTVFINEGWYHESLFIRKSIDLVGENKEKTILELGEGKSINVWTHHVHLLNFTISKDNGFEDVLYDGLKLKNADYCSIVNIHLESCGVIHDAVTPDEMSYAISVKDTFVNGKKLVYLEDIFNRTIDMDCGQIIVVNCNTITISNQQMNKTGSCIALFSSAYCNLNFNTISDTRYGIILQNSIYTHILGNTLIDNMWGILFGSCRFTVFSQNYFQGNERGIWDNLSPYITASNNTRICNNSFYDNTEGVTFYWANSVELRNNYFNENTFGLWFGWGTENISIKYNNFYSNVKQIYILDSIETSTVKIDKNYWGRPRFLPKPIFGFKSLSPALFDMIPWIFFDWHPAREPYDIDGGDIL